METIYRLAAIFLFIVDEAFNFLASLINGNHHKFDFVNMSNDF